MSLKNLALCYNAIVSSLDDPETPVRVHAALALSEMIRHTYGKKHLPHTCIANAVSIVQDAVKAIIGKILQSKIPSRAVGCRHRPASLSLPGAF